MDDIDQGLDRLEGIARAYVEALKVDLQVYRERKYVCEERQKAHEQEF